MTRVLGIVFVGMMGFLVAVGIALFVLQKGTPDVPSSEQEVNMAEGEPPVSTPQRLFCDASLPGVSMVRVVEGANAWLVLCSPGKPERILASLEGGQAVSGFETPLQPDELASRMSVEAEGDIDGDNVPEFVLAFAQGQKDCAFPGYYRVAKIAEGDRVVLSSAFGECLVKPVLRSGEKGKEFFVTSLPGKPGAEGKIARIENGVVVIADGRASEEGQASEVIAPRPTEMK
jgi:hypothetical protein